MVDYTGPWGMTDKQMDDFYMRWREVMLVARRHGAVPVANPVHKPVFEDLLARLAEDPWWVLAAPNLNIEPAWMIFNIKCHPNDLLFLVKKKGRKKLVRMAEVVNSKTGFGRFTAIKAPTREGVRPFATQIPKGLSAPKPDSELIVKPPKELRD